MITPTNFSWDEYVKNTKDIPPSALLVEALAYITHKDSALELGPGSFRDVKFLLENRFNHIESVNIDNSGEEIYNTLPKDKVSFIISSFENYNFKQNSFDLINAQYSLPFNPKSTFEDVLKRLKQSLKQNGVFTGQFFGDQDEWNTQNDVRTFHTKAEVLDLLSDLEILKINEKNYDGKLANGKPKHWHVFDVIAKKI